MWPMALMCPRKCWMSWPRYKVQKNLSDDDARPSLSVDYAWLIALSILFGLSFTLTSIGVRDIPPISLAAGRLLLAFLMLYPLMRLNGQRMPAMGPIWIALLGSGLFGNALPFALISWGQVTVQAGLTAIFMAVMPLATILLAHVFTDDEKLDRWKVLGVLFGLLGVIVLMGFSALNSLGDDLLRQSAILAAAVCYAINAIITRKLTKLPRWSAMTAPNGGWLFVVGAGEFVGGESLAGRSIYGIGMVYDRLGYRPYSNCHCDDFAHYRPSGCLFSQSDKLSRACCWNGVWCADVRRAVSDQCLCGLSHYSARNCSVTNGGKAPLNIGAYRYGESRPRDRHRIQ